MILFQPSIISNRNVGFYENLNSRTISNLTFKINDHYNVGLSHILTYQGYPTYLNNQIKALEQTTNFVLTYSF